VSQNIESLEVLVAPAAENAHYTELVLSRLHRPPQGRTLGEDQGTPCEHLSGVPLRRTDGVDFQRRGALFRGT
jgi:hypothetical protein